MVNGQNIATDVAPKNVNGRVLVPISTISKALGANVSWNAKTQTVTIRAEETGSKDIWNQTINTTGEEWGSVKRVVDLFLLGYDGQDQELVKSIVVEGFDKTFIGPGVYTPVGGASPVMLKHEILDAKKIGTGRDYKVRVRFVSLLGNQIPEEHTWDIDVTPKSSGGGYLVKKVDRLSVKELPSYNVFPGLTFTSPE